MMGRMTEAKPFEISKRKVWEAFRNVAGRGNQTAFGEVVLPAARSAS